MYPGKVATEFTSCVERFARSHQALSRRVRARLVEVQLAVKGMGVCPGLGQVTYESFGPISFFYGADRKAREVVRQPRKRRGRRGTRSGKARLRVLQTRAPILINCGPPLQLKSKGKRRPPRVDPPPLRYGGTTKYMSHVKKRVVSLLKAENAFKNTPQWVLPTTTNYGASVVMRNNRSSWLKVNPAWKRLRRVVDQRRREALELGGFNAELLIEVWSKKSKNILASREKVKWLYPKEIRKKMLYHEPVEVVYKPDHWKVRR